MDYCNQCLRHLNGALTCAGCGTPAEELPHRAAAPTASHHGRRHGRGRGAQEAAGGYGEFSGVPEGDSGAAYEVSAYGSGAYEGGTYGAGPHEGSGHADPGHGDTAYDDEPAYDDDPPYELAGHRRTREPARRTGRRGRSKTGRRILIGTLGVVLAAGALSLAQLAIEGVSNDPSTSVKEKDSGIDFDGAPQVSGRPASPGAVDPVSEPGPGGTSGSPGPSGSGDPSGSASPGASGSSSVTPGQESTDPTQPGSTGPGTPTTGQSGSSSPTDGTTPPPPPPPADPTPDPEPSETGDDCTHILWFCT